MDESKRVTRLTRRQLLKTSAVAGTGALAGAKLASVSAAPSFRERFSARYQSGGQFTFALQASDLQLIQPVLNEYTKSTGVNITTVPNPYQTLYSQMNITLTQATGAYDLVSMDDPWIPQFAGGGFLASLQDMMTKKGVKPDSDFVAPLLALGDFPKGSGLKAIPWVGNVQTFAWRTDVLQQMGAKVPATWDDVLALATKVTEANKANGLYGIGLRGQAGNPAATSFLPVLRGFGKDLLDPATSEPQLDTPEALAALTMQLKLRDQAPPGVPNVGHPENGQNLYLGHTAMSGDIWPDQLLLAFDPKVSKVVGKIEVGAEPAQSGVKPANMTGNWLLGIPDGAKNADKAFDFIMWFTSAERQKELLLNENVPATRTSVLTDKDAVAKLPFLPGLLKAAQNAVPRPRTPYCSARAAIYGRYVAEASAGQTAPDVALKKANQEMRDELVRDGVLK